jgi:hypothetical protein
MTKYYDTTGKEWIGDTHTLADGRVKSGKNITPESVRLLTAEQAAERGLEIVPHVPEKRVQKVKTKNTPTSLRKLKEQEDGGE